MPVEGRPSAAGDGRALAAEGSASEPWIVSADAARELIANGAIVLDAREPHLKAARRLPGAVTVRWEAFSQTLAPNQGLLLSDDAAMTRRLQALGLSARRPVVVVADPVRGWGEDGRIVWMLRTLGHPRAVLIDGGIRALGRGGFPQISKPAAPGDFVVHRDPRWLADREQVRAELGSPAAVFVDVREPREFAGATPYGESRGGHLPGARPLYYKDLLDGDGRLLPQAQLVRLLAAQGIDDGHEVIAYCTGGVRAAWFTSVLNDLGMSVRNYAGSMWEWSAQPAASYPLISAAE
ncbi:MAG: sulfurtransferase [Rhodospirillales bacterium]|nr:sulfurtransferase [Rhodospirillales bacterium]